MWDMTRYLFREYMGTGLLVIWFLLSVLYLFFTEKRKPVRIMFLYVPTILLLLFFNPLFAGIVYRAIGEEIYYRILWLLPITVVIAFAATDLFAAMKPRLGRIGQTVLGLSLAGGIAASGSLIYNNYFFGKAENIYHVPDAVVEICDAIVVPGREVMAVFPEECLQYVRQYTPLVRMPYGMEITVDEWLSAHSLYATIEAEEIDAEVLAAEAREVKCHYVILPEDKKLRGKLEDLEYREFDRIAGYVIYRDISDVYWNFKE